jgi:hypothetical protein
MPTDVAVFENGAVLRAEAADGTRVRVGTVRNDPQGDTEFWQRALIYHLESKYQKAEAVELDSLSLALFTSKDRDAYYYLVGTIPLVETEELVVVEVYFPHADALEKHYEDLLSSFGEVETS